MKRRTWIAIGIACAAILAAATIVFASRNDDLARVRRSTAGFQRPEVAQAAGWDLVPGLDHCFDNPGVGAMGYHYINTALLDTELDPLRPEAMVYELRPNGQLKLGAVEYIVPAADWDAISSELPALHGQSFHLNEDLGVYVLHAWIWKHNPAACSRIGTRVSPAETRRHAAWSGVYRAAWPKSGRTLFSSRQRTPV